MYIKSLEVLAARAITIHGSKNKKEE